MLRTLRNKLIFLVLVYFTGYSTAIYNLVPTSDDKTYKSSFAYLEVRPGELIVSYSKLLHDGVAFGKSAALRTADLIKQAYDQRNSQTDS
jgi:hypothetical protein